VALVLLIACVNIANLLLARAGVRRKEMAVRGALGAGRGRLVAQLLTESLVLSGAGAVLGVWLASFGVRFLVTHSPLGVPRLQDARLDTPVLLFTLGLAVACGIGFGLLPALRASRLDLQESLREGSRSDAAGVRGYLRSTLVVCQVAMAMVLLVGAGLLVRSAVLMQRVAPGFDTRNLLLVGVGLPSARYPNDTAVASRFDEILRGVSAVPGVAQAALVSRAPIADFGSDCNFRREGGANDAATFNANVRAATPGYFATLRVPLLRGRDLAASDAPGAPPVVVINRRLARELFGNENDAIGQRITCSLTTAEHPEWWTVIGITGDVHAGGLGDDVRDEVYQPSAQNVQRGMEIVIRGAVPVTTIAAAVRRVIGTLDPLLPVSHLRTMDDVIDESLATPRFTSELLSFLGVLGLALAVIGIYGVIAYFVAQRTYEIGIRMALGANSSRVLGMVVRQGLALAAVGIVIGTGASLLSTSVLSNLLYGVTARDPWTFAVVALLLALVALAATIIPARRAARVDPIVALRAP
jgi:predicted permease